MEKKNPDLLCILFCSQLEQAAETAFQMKREDELNLVLSKCTGMHHGLAQKIQGLKAQLHAK